MLSKNLLLTVKKNNNVAPKYLLNVSEAESLIKIFKNNIGCKYKKIMREIQYLEEESKNYKIIRGLGSILIRNCRFEGNSSLHSVKLRNFLFEKGFALNDSERKNVLQQASDFFNISIKKIEETIFSDLLEEKTLIKMLPLTPLDLIKKYNLSLTQALLFNSLELIISVASNFQQIFREINYLGMMYEVEKGDSGNFFIRITGPASLFKKTKKYGTSFAKLLINIIKADKWELSAKIEMKRGNEPRIYDFNLKSGDSSLFPNNNDEIIEFDSKVEAQFYRNFKAYCSSWEIKREPTIIKTKNYITIPDFGFYKHGKEIFLEVVGFWTPQYLEKKIWKLKNAEKMIMVAVNQTLNCDKEDFPSDVIFYKDNIPIKPIIKILNKIEEEHVQLEIKKLKNIGIAEDIISIEKKAEELNVSNESLKKIDFDEHIIIGDKIVSLSYIQVVKKEIGSERNYNKIVNIVAHHGLSMRILDHMGYKIEWKGLVPVRIVTA